MKAQATWTWTELLPGNLIAGRYRAVRKMAEGGMAEVWEGIDVQDGGTPVALKRLRPALSCDREGNARFRREAALLGQIESERVSRLRDFVEDPTFGLVLVQQLVDGRPLSDIVRTERFTVEEAITLGIDILEALSVLHRAGIVHRDLKPGNILLSNGPAGRHAIIIDLGLSRRLGQEAQSAWASDGTELTTENHGLGTIEYMAPEQLLDARHLTEAADVYGVGAILYRAVAGEHVFGSQSGLALARHKLIADARPLATGRIDETAQGFETIVARALRSLPGERYRSAQLMRSDLLALQAIARGRKAGAWAQLSTGSPVRPPAARPRRSLALAAVPLFALGLLASTAAGAVLGYHMRAKPALHDAIAGRAVAVPASPAPALLPVTLDLESPPLEPGLVAPAVPKRVRSAPHVASSIPARDARGGGFLVLGAIQWKAPARPTSSE